MALTPGGAGGGTKKSTYRSGSSGNSTGYWTDVSSRLGTKNTMSPSVLNLWKNNKDSQGRSTYFPNRQLTGNEAAAYGDFMAWQNGVPGPTLPPPGGKPRGGGGGYGGGMAAPQMTQGNLDQLLGLYKKAKPGELQFNPYESEFYDFDSSLYDQMLAGIDEAYAADRASGLGRYDDAAQALGIIQENRPYQQAYAQTPGMSDAMRRMYAANGGAGAAAYGEEMAMNGQADQAFGHVLRGLDASQDMYNKLSNLGLMGDRRGFEENLDAGKRSDTLGVNMARGQAQQQHNKDAWQHADNVAMMNWQRGNQVSDTNVGNLNAHKAGMLDPLTQLFMAYPQLKFGAANGLF